MQNHPHEDSNLPCLENAKPNQFCSNLESDNKVCTMHDENGHEF